MEKIAEIEEKFVKKYCFYLIELPKIIVPGIDDIVPIYKFGITEDIKGRIVTHQRNLKFTRIIGVWDCLCAETMRNIENTIKNLAKTNGELKNIMGNTELIQCLDIQKYIDRVTLDIVADNPRSDNAIEATPIINSDKICVLCNKEFKKQSDFERHLDRKTPCVIQSIDPKYINDPKRCTYCNKVYSRMDNLTKHLKICKVKKNAPINVTDGIRLEYEMRQMKEQMYKKDEQLKMLIERIHALEIKAVAKN
jgi:hypothetical protein